MTCKDIYKAIYFIDALNSNLLNTAFSMSP